jgi:shikimate kinase
MNLNELQGRVILLIGPSGVGKSDYGQHVAKTVPGCRFYDLDSLVGERSGTPASQLLPQIRDDAFLHLCQQEVEVLLQSSTEDVAVVAVGAGALQSGEAHAWLSRYSGGTIAVVAAAEEVYKRGGPRNKDRTLEGFKKVEYSECRQRLYETARYQCCVTGLSLEKARARFTDLIRKLVMQSHGETAA